MANCGTVSVSVAAAACFNFQMLCNLVLEQLSRKQAKNMSDRNLLLAILLALAFTGARSEHLVADEVDRRIAKGLSRSTGHRQRTQSPWPARFLPLPKCRRKGKAVHTTRAYEARGPRGGS